MEPPPGSLEDLQPQDLSTSSLPSIIDLSRRGEQCVPLDALRRVKSPGWYLNSTTTTNPGLSISSDTSSVGVTSQPGEHHQPDEAFSHTTVTLSYVSRSHVFSQESTPHLPPISKFSLNQHFLERVEGPVDLAIQTEPGQDGEEPCGLNGGRFSYDGEGEVGQSRAMDNGHGESPSPETPSAAQKENGDSDVVFLMSKKPNPAAVVLGSLAARDLCSPGREYTSPLDEPISPSATSLDDVEDVFTLPQTSCSPSGDNNRYMVEAEEEEQERTESDRTLQEESDPTKTEENQEPLTRLKALIVPLIDLTEDVSVSGLSENKADSALPHINGTSKTLQRSLQGRKLPVRSGRGTKMSAIVMNINSSRYKVSGCIRTSKKPSTASSPTESPTEQSTSKEVRRSRAKRSVSAKAAKQIADHSINADSTSDSKSLSVVKKTQNKLPTKSPEAEKSSRRDSKTVSPPVTSPPTSRRRRSSQSSPQEEEKKTKKNSKKEPEPCVETRCSPKKSPGKAKGTAVGSKPSPATKTKSSGSAKRVRKKKAQVGQCSSMFSPKEPEIRLKYVNYKEEKREARCDGFSPYVHVERRPSSSSSPCPSRCTVINYPEEVKEQQKKKKIHHPPSGDFISAAIPSTSCLQLGRPSTQNQNQQRSLVCCLCGQPANAMDLGDLHGPYHPEGHQTTGAKTQTGTASPSQIKEEDFSDSDSSAHSVRRGRRRKSSAPPPWSDGLAAKRARSDPSAAADDGVEDWYSAPVLPQEPREYWLHEECGIWSAGVFLVRGRVYGLEEAVKAAQEMTCSACHGPGATLGCFFKGCPNKYHYRCSLGAECSLIEENFSMKCKKHKDKTFKGPAGNRGKDR